MISRQIDTRRTFRPLPISILINTANTFHCDIRIECAGGDVDAKNYDEVLRNLNPCSPFLLFYFNGNDEQAAQKTFERIFQN